MIVGIFSLLLVVGFLSTIGISWRILTLIVPVSIVAFAYVKNSVTNPTVMIVNKSGFYYYGELITNWKNFIDVEFIEMYRYQIAIRAERKTGFT